MPSHPKSSRDSLHEADMWPSKAHASLSTKVLAEMLPLVRSTAAIARAWIWSQRRPASDQAAIPDSAEGSLRAMLDYLRKTPRCATSSFPAVIWRMSHRPARILCVTIMDIPNIKDIRLATKGLMGIPQHSCR